MKTGNTGLLKIGTADETPTTYSSGLCECSVDNMFRFIQTSNVVYDNGVEVPCDDYTKEDSYEQMVVCGVAFDEDNDEYLGQTEIDGVNYPMLFYLPIIKTEISEGEYEYSVGDTMGLPAPDIRHLTVYNQETSDLEESDVLCMHVTNTSDELPTMVNTYSGDVSFVSEINVLGVRIVGNENLSAISSVKIDGVEIPMEDIIDNNGFWELSEGEHDIEYELVGRDIPNNTFASVPLEQVRLGNRSLHISPSAFFGSPLLDTDENTIARIVGSNGKPIVINAEFDDEIINTYAGLSDESTYKPISVYPIYKGKAGLSLCAANSDSGGDGPIK